VTAAARRALCALALVAPACALAQDLVQAPRKEGPPTPMRAYEPAAAGCAPLALISPGAGGSEDGYAYLALALQKAGWRAAVMGHRKSGRAALRARKAGLREGLEKLTTDPAAYEDRQLDIGAALAWALRSCKAPFTALIGHSMGAATVMIEAGAHNRMGVSGGDRFDAYVALSPQGPGSIFPENAWSGIQKPMLIMTGTRDRALEGSWQSRTVPFASLPAGCKRLAVVDGATHMSFAGRGQGDLEKAILAEITAFLDGVRSAQCGVPPRLDGVAVTQK